MKAKGTLFLLPNLLGSSEIFLQHLPPEIIPVVAGLDGLIAESETQGRGYLKRFPTARPAHHIPIALLNEHTKPDEISFLLEPLLKGERWGIVSDAGLPCIADPGALLVGQARKKGVLVHGYSGPCSITLALMLSGIPSQKFFFQGYLPKVPAHRKTAIIRLIEQSKQEKATQVMIEAPYRNQHTLKDLVDLLPTSSLLSVAWDLTLPSQDVITAPVTLWKTFQLPKLDQNPAVFLFRYV